MNVLYICVSLQKNEHFSTPVWIYPWELPVFAAAHRKNGITEIGRKVFKKLPNAIPQVATEYDRLEVRYKGPEGSDISYVAAVYGHGSMGLKKLQEAMQEAAKETQAYMEHEANNPEPAAKPKGPEFESPFGELPELPADENDQAGLRAFVGGDDSVTIEAA